MKEVLTHEKNSVIINYFGSYDSLQPVLCS